MKKALAFLMTAMIAATSMGVSAFAADDSQNQAESLVSLEMIVEDADGNVTVHDITKDAKVMELKDGTMVPVISPRGNLSEHDIDVGSTMWYTGKGDGYKLKRSQKVTFKASFNKTISYEAGYDGAGYTSVAKSGKGSSFSTTITMPADGTYEFYITNESSSAVTVKSGSITY